MPIINPWLFYVISLFDSAKELMKILQATMIVYCVVVGFIYCFELEEGNGTEILKSL